MPLQLARQPRRLYRTNTLKKVICQLRHPYQHRYDEPAYLTAFQSRLGDRLPRTSKQTQLALVLSPDGGRYHATRSPLHRFPILAIH